MTISILCNIRTAVPSYLKNGIIDVYLGDQLAAPTVATPSAPSPIPSGPTGSGFPLDVGNLRGTYFSEELDVRWTLQPGAINGIALQRRNLPPVALVSRDSTNTRFTVAGAPAEVRFERDPSDRVTGFVLTSGDITGIRFVKLK